MYFDKELTDTEFLLSIQKKAQYGYGIMTRQFDFFQEPDTDRARFIVYTIIESSNGIVDTSQMDQLFNADFFSGDYSSAFFEYAQYLDRVIEINTIPGYEDYWFSVGIEDDGSIALVLYLAESEIGYSVAEAEDLNLVIDFSSITTLIPWIRRNASTKRFRELRGFLTVDSLDGGQQFMVSRDDGLPLTNGEIEYIEGE